MSLGHSGKKNIKSGILGFVVHKVRLQFNKTDGKKRQALNLKIVEFILFQWYPTPLTHPW